MHSDTCPDLVRSQVNPVIESNGGDSPVLYIYASTTLSNTSTRKNLTLRNSEPFTKLAPMKSALVRTGSVPVLSPAGAASSSFSNYRPLHGVFSGQKSCVSSPKISLHFETNHRRGTQSSGIRRVSSESDITRSLHEIASRYDQFGGAGYRSFPSRIPEEECLLNDSREGIAEEPMIQEEKDEFDISNYAGGFPGDGISMEDTEFFDSGIGSGAGGKIVTHTFSGGSNERGKIGAYYEEMLKLNPGDSLLLRNYGKFLHEVENDTVRAEEYYGRAILASPGDGELLSLYGQLVWETQRDEEIAKSYFDRAVYASPNDCSVLGSYAHFLWEVEAEEEEEEAAEKADVAPPALVAAF